MLHFIGTKKRRFLIKSIQEKTPKSLEISIEQYNAGHAIDISLLLIPIIITNSHNYCGFSVEVQKQQNKIIKIQSK